MISKRRSTELNEIAMEYMPGPHSNLGKLTQSHPIFIEHGKGSHIYDVDGNDYIDYINSLGPGILGYGNEEYINSVSEQLKKLCYLNSGDLRSIVEIELSEKIVKHIPCAEKVRFALTGTEANQLAIRLARAYTGKSHILRFEGQYYGWLDNVLGGVVTGDWDNPIAAYSEKDPNKTKGRDMHAFNQSFLIPWNDIETFENVLNKHKDEIALVLMEPISLNSGCCLPREGYLERVRALCSKYNILLCFDEVQTGFRVSLNGAQGMLGITPDISTFGKALGGGIIIGAIAGKKEIMAQLLNRSVIGAGTFNGNPLSLASALATLKILEKDEGALYKRIEITQKLLATGIKEIAKRHGIPLLIQGPTGVFYCNFIDKDIIYSPVEIKEADYIKLGRFVKGLFDMGVLVVGGGRWFISSALSENDIDKTLDIVSKVMSDI